MPAPRFRSRSLRRVQRRMPGGKVKRVYLARKPGVVRCAVCGAELQGIPRLSLVKAKNISKSKKRPERPYGGFLCNNCVREKLKQEARLTGLTIQ
ncbi:MAG TPA: 50S ribosomal protein L34e [Candidatus Nanoarchaeia archaeon]|nr:50S ribosomal protein L34e [Candidatus Nanoarchaeia archaeon]